MRKDFTAGIRAGVPVCLGYFSVSFGFGVMAVSKGLNPWDAILISLSNLTSAGQFAGLNVIVAGAALIEMILTQLVINSRYALMSVALGQKLGPKVGTGKRLAMAFFNTDEVFALGMTRLGKLSPAFFLGAGLIAALGWTAGTALGAAAGAVLPLSVRLALGTMLYGMFIAIVIPQIRTEKTLLFPVLISVLLSSAFYYLPLLSEISSGIAMTICAVVAAVFGALVFPVKPEEQEDEARE